MMQALIDSLREQRMNVVRPTGERFPPPWISKTLGVSTLVKHSAYNIAKGIIERDERFVDPYLGWRGNTLADALLKKVTPHRECTITCVGLLDDQEWTLSGHPDGLSHAHHPDTGVPLVVVDEAKSHGHPNPLDVDIATRQARSYLGMLAYCHAHGVDSFKPSGHADADAQPFHLDALWCGDGVVVTDMLALFDPDIEPTPITAEEAEQELNRIRRKANAVLRAVAAGDAEVALRDFDDTPEGRVEFQRTGRSLYAGAIKDPKRLAGFAKTIADAKALKKAETPAKQELHAYLRELGEDCIELPCGTKIWRTRHANPHLEVRLPVKEAQT